MGRYGGQLRDVCFDDMVGVVIWEVADRVGVRLEDVTDVVMGCANQAGEDNRNVARMGLLLAGFPVEVPGQTVNPLCGAGMQATVAAARESQTGGGGGHSPGGRGRLTPPARGMGQQGGGA